MSLYLFDNSQQLIKVVPTDQLIMSKQTQEINSLDMLEVELPHVAELDDSFYMAVKDVYDRFAFHMYRIVNKETEGDTVYLNGNQLGYDELKAHGYIKDLRPTNRDARFVAEQIVEGTGWSVRYVSDKLKPNSTNFYYLSRLEAMSKFLNVWDAEIIFKIAITGSRITEKWIELHSQVGRDTNKRFAYGTNLLSVVKEEDHSEVYTALVGRGRGVATEDEQGEETGGYSRKITFAEVVWSLADGDPADKPLSQEWLELPERTAIYGYTDGSPRTGIAEFDTEDPEELLTLTYQALQESSRPKVQFKASVANVGDMMLGDRVAIIRHDLNFRYITRVFKVERDLLNNNQTIVELGDHVETNMAKRLKQIDLTLNQRDDEIVNVIQMAANRKNRVFRGEFEPVVGMVKNDLWYKPVTDPETGEPGMMLHIYNGEIWDLDKVSANMLSGTLDAENGDVNLINVNVANIVGETSNFVRSWWNNISTSVFIDGEGVHVSNNNNSINASLRDGFIEFGDDSAEKVGGMSTAEVFDQDTYYDGVTVFTHYNKFFAVNKQWTPNGPYEPVIRTAIREKGLNIYPTVTLRSTLNLDNNQIHDVDRIYFGDTTEGLIRDFSDNTNLLISRGGVRLGVGSIAEGFSTKVLVYDSRTRITNNLEVEGHTAFSDTVNFGRNQLHDVDRIYMNGTTNGLRTSGGRPFLDGHIGVYLAYAGQMKIETQSTLVRLHATLDMNGNTLLNQSDIRLKSNVEDSTLDALNEIDRMKFIEFDWDKEKTVNEGKPDGRQFGIVAQYSPFLQTKAGDSDSYLSVDLTKQVNLNSKAIQELSQKVKELEANGERTSFE